MPPKTKKPDGNLKRRPHSKISTHVRHSVAPTSLPAQEKPNVPFKLQQDVLRTFAKVSQNQDPNEIRERIQKVKGFLYARDFDGAFSSPENQEAYCLRWSPSRALAYLDLAFNLRPIERFLGLQETKASQFDESVDNVTEKVVVCIGGGAGAEIVSFATASAWVHELYRNPEGDFSSDRPSLKLTAVDIADWSVVFSSLEDSLKSVFSGDEASGQTSSTSPPLTLAFKHADILDMTPEDLSQMLSGASETASQALVTLFFTLNELYSSSMPRTTAFLLRLAAVVQPGTLLLVVDSPGSYSTVKIGSAEKKYPMQWMLDHTLLEASKAEGEPQWQKLDCEESRWWRMNRSELKYSVPGIELEDMRMQWHLYKRL